MESKNQSFNPDLIGNAFSKFNKNGEVNQQSSKSRKAIGSKMNVDSDQEILNAAEEQNRAKLGVNLQQNQTNRKKAPEIGIQQKPQIIKMQIQTEGPKRSNQRFSQLPDEIVYQYSFHKLFITGVMQNGQTINIISSNTYRELYFALKKEQIDSEQLSKDFMMKAKQQIDKMLKKQNIKNIKEQQCAFQNRQYVFEIDGVCREMRPYYKVRYGFENKFCPTPDWEGEYFKYVFGTTYTPLELFILNNEIKGPCWVRVNKDKLRQTKLAKDSVQSSLCVEIEDTDSIQVFKDMVRPPYLRVMSVNVKVAIPGELEKISLFPKVTRREDPHIYCISYTFCDQYQVELKPPKYNQIQKTYYLKSIIDKDKQIKQDNFQGFENEINMIGKFQTDLNRLDPDVIVCHDSSKILDTLVQRMSQLGDKNVKPKLGRLFQVSQSYGGASNQHQRLSAALAGRLVVDTFIHSKDMIKSVDYDLQTMSKKIKPQKKFEAISDEKAKQFLNDYKGLFVLKEARDQADVTFALMNHLEVLQLTRNLSNICGNLWRRSLQNQRAERNEFLIMHDCKKRDLIIPDKFKNFKNQQQDEEIDRKKYAGGMVIEPKKGMYNDFIILLDFNSLYPSIIRQYNVCFSKLDRPRLPLSKFYKPKKDEKKKDQTIKGEDKQNKVKKQSNDDEMQFINPPPKEECQKQKWGFLPKLIDGIVKQRLKCKKAMKTATAQKCIILDIQQKSYKIVANSIYGCLGFSISRFYSKPMAALITRMGRQALQRANDIVTKRGGVEVIYGDTDSLMIQPTSLNKETDKEKLFEIKSIADQLKKQINKDYKNLEIDIDGIFKPILLLMKKKYVANKLQNFDKIIVGVEHQLKFQLEFKGIEVVRRDGCEVARRSLKRILEILMNSKKEEVQQIYEQIYEYASELGKVLPTLPAKDFLFSKQLNKKLKEYNNGQSLPHVKVAMDRVKNGQKEQTLVNHTIYYLVCKEKSQGGLAKRCFDDKAYERSIKYSNNPEERLQIDMDYYKQEIIHPWMKIFMHLNDFSEEKLFDSFGVQDGERKKIKKMMNTEKDYADQGMQEFLTNDMKQKSRKFNEQISSINCPNGHQLPEFCTDGHILTQCPQCPADTTTKQITTILSNKLSMWMKTRSSRYYSNKYKCECHKQYLLTPINKCCRVQTEKKTTIPCEIHTFVYIAKELIEVTVNKLEQKIKAMERRDLNEDPSRKEEVRYEIERLESICERLLKRFLENSDFENITGMFDMFKV